MKIFTASFFEERMLANFFCSPSGHLPNGNVLPCRNLAKRLLAKCQIPQNAHFLNARFRCDPLPKWLKFPRWPIFGILIFELTCYFTKINSPFNELSIVQHLFLRFFRAKGWHYEIFIKYCLKLRGVRL